MISRTKTDDDQSISESKSAAKAICENPRVFDPLKSAGKIGLISRRFKGI
jgi:hypothetical protein